MSLISDLFQRRQKRRALASLRELDDHLLRDIGLDRSDLHLMMSGVRAPHNRGPRSHE